MATLSEDSQRLLDTLREAGREAVERKCRLGQYAVIWRDGAPAFIGPNPPDQEMLPSKDASFSRSVSSVRKSGRDQSAS